MLRALWFFIKVGLLIAAAVWLANRPGMMVVDWLGYHIEIRIGVAIVALALIIIICAQIYRLWRGIIGVPAWYRRFQEARTKEKGYAALTRGLVAVAAGDPKRANKESKKANKLIPDVSLVTLLSAQSALLNDDHDTATKKFHELMKDESVSFFGVRGLLNQALRNGENEKALELVRKADSMQPKTKWILQTLFDLEVQSRDWKAAETTLYRALKAKVFDKKQFKSFNIAIHLARAELAAAKGNNEKATNHAREAWRLNDLFVPAIDMYVSSLVHDREYKKAQKILEKAWKREDHPDLARAWIRLGHHIHDNDPLSHAQWVQKLIKLNPDSSEAKCRYAIAAMEASLWGEARGILEKLERTQPSERVYLALSDLEMHQFKDETKSKYWLKKAANAEIEPEWTCTNCHHHAVRWTAICSNCGTFNTMEWGLNDFNIHSPHRILLQSEGGFIEPPIAKIKK